MTCASELPLELGSWKQLTASHAVPLPPPHPRPLLLFLLPQPTSAFHSFCPSRLFPSVHVFRPHILHPPHRPRRVTSARVAESSSTPSPAIARRHPDSFGLPTGPRSRRRTPSPLPRCWKAPLVGPRSSSASTSTASSPRSAVTDPAYRAGNKAPSKPPMTPTAASMPNRPSRPC